MDDRDLERLFSDHADALFGFLAYRTGDRDLAEDLVAESFERVFKARRRFDSRRAGAKTWLYAIALNCLRDHERRRGSESRALARHEDGFDHGSINLSLDRFVERDEVMRAVATLPVPEREAIALRFGADLTMPEIATVTGEKVSTVEGRVYRALRKLRIELEA